MNNINKPQRQRVYRENFIVIKKHYKIYSLLLFLIIAYLLSCAKTEKIDKKNNVEIFKAPISKEKIPSDLIWLTNDADPIFASSEAKKGGAINTYMYNFPLTFRLFGPDSSGSFSTYLSTSQLSLISLHPNTEKIIPQLASHWAFGKDNRTMYFKLYKNALWSDGKPVTAHDFAYKIEFARSDYIQDPAVNKHYREEIDKIIVYDDYTLAVVLSKPKPDLYLYTNITPISRHFYKELNKDFVQKYNWEIQPTTGPYTITDFKKGKYVTFTRIKNWWAKDLKYYKYRFNFDKIKFKVIKEINVIWELFKKGDIDVFPAMSPEYWYDKSNTKVFNNGYINKIWFFNDTRQSASGLFLNQDVEIFKDKNVRYAFAHAMNFDKIINEILRNEYYRLDHGYVGYGKYTNNNIKAREYDIDKVNYYMKKSGWSRGNDGIWKKNNNRFSVELSFSGESSMSSFVVLKEEAQKAGIELKLENLDSATLYKKVFEKKHEVVAIAWSTGVRPAFRTQYHSDYAHKKQNNNITNTDDKELVKLIDEYKDTINEDERIKLSHIIQKKIHEIGSYIPSHMIPYARQMYWRWWKLPAIPGTKNSEDTLFHPFVDYTNGFSTGGLYWFDEEIYKETKQAMKKGIKFKPVTIIDDTYKMESLKKEGNK
jgi:microcin C transport system substrate-binding protein